MTDLNDVLAEPAEAIQSEPSDRKVFFLLLAAALACGLWALYSLGRDYRAYATWPRTPARVTGIAHCGRSCIEVQYAYQVRAFTFAGETSSPFQNYHRGEAITVYYDPARPGDSIASQPMFIDGIVAVLLATGCLFAAWLRHRSTQ